MVCCLLAVTPEVSSSRRHEKRYRGSHELPIGAKTWDAIDEAIRVRDNVLLVLSQTAIDSDWIENEVSKAYA